MPKDPPETFHADILHRAMTDYLLIPKQVSEAIKERGLVPVLARINSYEARLNLVPTRDHHHRLILDKETLRNAGAFIGDNVEVMLEFGKTPKSLEIPEKLAAALNAGNVYHKFLDLDPARQERMIQFYKSLRTRDARARAIAVMVQNMKS